MIKVQPKARFICSAYRTNFETTDKKLASLIFDYLSENTENIVEADLPRGAKLLSVKNNDTYFETYDKALAIEVMEYLEKNQTSFLKEQIKKLKAEIDA